MRKNLLKKLKKVFYKDPRDINDDEQQDDDTKDSIDKKGMIVIA